MRRTLRILLVIYLVVLLLLAMLPLTGYYAAAGALPVAVYYLYRRLRANDATTKSIVTRGIFLLATFVFLIGFALNFFCTVYTAWRMGEFKKHIESDKNRIYQKLKDEKK